MASSPVLTQEAASTLLQVTVPPQQSPGVQQLSLSCLGEQNAFITFVGPPTVSSVQAREPCYTLAPCSLIVTISNPPDTVRAFTGDVQATFVGPAGDGNIVRWEVLAVGESLLLLVKTPAYATHGQLQGTIAPTTAPKGFTLAQATCNMTFVIAPAPVFITSISPRFGFVTGGTSVRISISGLPKGTAVAPQITFGAVQAGAGTVLVSDESSTIITVSSPASSSTGPVLVSVANSASDTNSSAYFAYSSQGLSAACVTAGGCEAGVQGGLGVKLTLTGFSPVISSLTVTAGDAAAPVSVISVEGGVATLSLPSAAAAGVSTSSGNGGAIPAFLAVTEAGKTAYAQILYRAPPSPEDCTFTPSGARLWLTFDQDTDQTDTEVDCLTLLTPNAPTALGVDAKCSWALPSRLVVVLGAGASILPGDSLSVKPGLIKSKNLITDAAPLALVTVLTPEFPEPPTIVVNAPTDVGSCDTIDISVQGPSSRPMTYAFSSPFDATLDGTLSSFTTAFPSFPASALPLPDVAYQISVTATTFLGGVSAPSIISVTRRLLPPPLVSILRPAGPVYTTNANQLEASATFSACLATTAAVDFQWTLSDSSRRAAVLTSSSAVLKIPAGTLTAGVDYRATLVALQTGGGATTLETVISPQASALVALISGGDSRTVSGVSEAPRHTHTHTGTHTHTHTHTHAHTHTPQRPPS